MRSVDFGVVLLLSAAGSAPWDGIAVVAVLWGLVGLSGVVYVVLVARRLRLQAAYQAVFEDWLFHVLLPFASYAMLAASACAAYSHPRPALFVVEAGVADDSEGSGRDGIFNCAQLPQRGEGIYVSTCCHLTPPESITLDVINVPRYDSRDDQDLSRQGDRVPLPPRAEGEVRP